jgi:hypothetical protein
MLYSGLNHIKIQVYLIFLVLFAHDSIEYENIKTYDIFDKFGYLLKFLQFSWIYCLDLFLFVLEFLTNNQQALNLNQNYGRPIDLLLQP